MIALPFDYWIGCDLGQRHDYTTLAVVEEQAWIPGRLSDADRLLAPAGAAGWTGLDGLRPVERQHWRRYAEQHGRPAAPPLALRHLARWRDVSYPATVSRIQALLATAPLSTSNTVLVVDATGVGRAVVDLMVAVGLHPMNVTIHGGNEIHADLATSEASVPKRELVVAAQLALQQGRLRIAAGLEHADTLVDELRNYQVKISPAGHDSYNAREGQHDDLVLATALAVWFRGWYCRWIDEPHIERERSLSHV
jgi:hypothetical protein